MSVLEREGLVQVQQGRGTYVRPDDMPVMLGMNFDADWNGLVDFATGTKHVLRESSSLEHLPASVAGGVATGSPYRFLQLLNLQNGQRVMCTNVYLEHSVYDHAGSKFEQSEPVSVLLQLPGVNLARIEQSIRCSKPDQNLSSLLAISAGELVMTVRRHLFDSQNKLFGIVMLYFKAELLTLETLFKFKKQ